MQIVNVDQNSPEWDELRKPRMTASHATAIATCGKGLDTYIEEKMEAIYMIEEAAGYKNKTMDRGSELEDSAAFLYSLESDEETKKVGFVVYSDYVGCSPDLFVGEKGMAQIKCPLNKEFFRLMRGGKVKPGDVWQMQMEMLVSEREWNDYVVYSPNPRNADPLIIQRFKADPAAFRKLEAGFIKGVQLMNEIKNQLGEI
jgi:hypothetical protein